MTTNELHVSFERLKSFQKLQILRDIEASYQEIVSDIELTLDAMLSNVTIEDAFYKWREEELAHWSYVDRMAS